MMTMTECNFDLELTNFQSIASAKMQFKKGINLIVGQSNSGKSATLRAVKAAVLNASGSQRFIKNGTEESTVNFKYRNNDVNWYRTKKESKYTVNEEDYIKVGNSNLFKIQENNGFVVDEKNNLMNIEGELELPFPFDRSSSELFKLFENVFCVSDSTTILKAIKSEEESASRNKGKSIEELERVSRKLSALDDLEKEVDLNKLKLGKEKLIGLMDSHTKYNKDYTFAHSTNLLIDKLELSDNNVSFTSDSILSYSKIVKDYGSIWLSNKLALLVRRATEAPEVSNTLLDKYQSTVSDYNEIYKVSQLCALDLKDINIDSAPVEKLIRMRKDFRSMGVLMKLLKLVRDVEEPVFDSKSIEKLESLKRDYEKFMSNENKIAELEDKIEKELIKLKETTAKLGEFKACPLCGSSTVNN